ncbi:MULTISPECIES: hypothetical protein [Aeromonas]|uniref:Uncharacterized protein n=1 Tax=Aeromonas caviae TaxID=648 RepID=A0AAW9EWU5_AERCA|nr:MULTISPECIES: hypothetical protein [Aeromonas]MBP8279544.1 hypothetical protein [Aeromonas sp.]MBL0497335.1 hypothetical protein [Aeromonas caviae]MBL0654173.1 hypothetical protein [Aeromonas caviae]MBS4637686.1 hypothetical protein [Aeromonas caviae]MCR3893022.1 hypothetical protein [Aeromonas caviae]
MKHWSLLLLPLAMASLSSHAAVLPSDCSSKDVAIGSAVNSATGVNSHCSAQSAKQRVDNAVNDPAGYAKRKAAQATGVDDAYYKAKNTQQRVENAVDNPGDYAKRKAAEAAGVGETYNKAKNTQQRVENVVDDPAKAAGRAVLRKTGTY